LSDKVWQSIVYLLGILPLVSLLGLEHLGKAWTVEIQSAVSFNTGASFFFCWFFFPGGSSTSLFYKAWQSIVYLVCILPVASLLELEHLGKAWTVEIQSTGAFITGASLWNLHHSISGIKDGCLFSLFL
jgi:hypothetical protein